MIGFSLQETLLPHDHVYATIIEDNTDSSGSNASDLQDFYLNSSLVGSTMTNSTQSDTSFGNFTASPINFNASGGPPVGTLQIPYTGLSRYHATPDIAKFFGLNETTYAMIITGVEPRSPADRAGIKSGNMTTSIGGDIIKIGGDIVLKIDGNDTHLRTNEAFLNYLQNEKRVGENMTLTVLRDGQIQDIELTIGTLPRFLWYEDNDEGIKVKYPSDWEISGSEAINDVVKFFSPQAVRAGNETIPAAGIFVLTAPTVGRNLDDLASTEQKGTRDRRHLGITLTSISNLPAYESVSYDYSEENRTLKELSMFTINDDKLYRINFATDPSRFNDYLPLARQVITSLQFTS